MISSAHLISQSHSSLYYIAIPALARVLSFVLAFVLAFVPDSSSIILPLLFFLYCSSENRYIPLPS